MNLLRGCCHGNVTTSFCLEINWLHAASNRFRAERRIVIRDVTFLTGFMYTNTEAQQGTGMNSYRYERRPGII